MGHEMRFLELVAEHTAEQSLTVIAVTHHLNTAARFADRMILLSEGRLVADGPARDVLTPRRLESAFGWPVEIRDLGLLGRHAIPKRREPEEAAE
jgi:iron complex transport system ATP-binding protein